MRTCLALIMVLLAAAVHAQQLTGTVVDAKTSAPIPFASIRLLPTDIQVWADANGTFRLTYTRDTPCDSLLVSSARYWPTRVAVDMTVSSYKIGLVRNEADTSVNAFFRSLSEAKNWIEKCLQDHTDSIADYRHSRVVPAFLTDPCFDWHPKCLDHFHNVESYRWKILSRVTNKKSLKMLLRDAGEQLKTKCTTKETPQGLSGYQTPELNTVSTYELIKRRLRQLR